MRIAVGSAFRNSAGNQVQRYLHQVDGLRSLLVPAHTVRIIAVEGDSTDLTVRDLQRGAFARDLPLELVTHNHGYPWFGSTESPVRMAALSGVGNAIFDAVIPQDDVLVYVESDLLWGAHTVARLVQHVVDWNCDVVAPMVWAGKLFYDVWAFRGLDGARFSPFPPYHADIKPDAVLTPVGSVGSCLVMRAEIARTCRIRNGGALVDWCADARAHGYSICVDSQSWIDHPVGGQ